MQAFKSVDLVTAQGERVPLMDRDSVNDGIWVKDWTGLGMSDRTVVSVQGATQHGSTVEEVYLDERIIQFMLYLQGCDAGALAANRKDLAYWFLEQQSQFRCGGCGGTGCMRCTNVNTSPRLEFEYCIEKRHFLDATLPDFGLCGGCAEEDFGKVERPAAQVFTETASYMRFNQIGIHTDCYGNACNPYALPDPEALVGLCNHCGLYKLLGPDPMDVRWGMASLRDCDCHKQGRNVHVRKSIDIGVLIGGLEFDQNNCRKRLGAWNIKEQVTLLAGDPIVYDTEQTKQLVLPGSTGTFRTEDSLLYAGQLPSAPEFVIEGPIENPYIEHYGLCQTLALNLCVKNGEHLRVDMASGEIEVFRRGQVAEDGTFIAGEGTSYDRDVLDVDSRACLGNFSLIPPRPRSTWRDCNVIAFGGDGAGLSTALTVRFRNKDRVI